MSQEFHKIICDFVSDLKTTFPEYTPLMDKWWKNDEKSCKFVFEHCQKKMPPRFFDILNKNEDMFKEASHVDTEFLPSIQDVLGFHMMSKYFLHTTEIGNAAIDFQTALEVRRPQKRALNIINSFCKEIEI